MGQSGRTLGRLAWLLAAGLGWLWAVTGHAAEFQVLYDLAAPHQGAVPLVAGPDGALYGTLAGDTKAGNTGSVFRLAPPRAGQTAWTYATLYAFHGNPDHTGDGADPDALVIDAAGHLFGTTSVGGVSGFGTAFELTPPPGGGTPWIKTTLFDGYASDAGGFPTGQIHQSSNGTLYGLVTQGYVDGKLPPVTQAAYRLMPPASGSGPWVYKTLHPFTKTQGANDFGVTRGVDGALYGAGGLWRLVPPTWRYERLYTGFAQFQPALDRSLNMYVADGGTSHGKVYRVSPPGPGQTSWTRTDLYTFKSSSDGRGPFFTMAEGPDASLYGVTVSGGGAVCCGSGLVFRLTPRGGGTTYPWNKVDLHVFSRGADGGFPDAGLLRVVRDGRVTLFGTTSAGGAHGRGTVFMITP